MSTTESDQVQQGNPRGTFRPWGLAWVLTAAERKAREATNTATSGPPRTHSQLESTQAGDLAHLSTRHHFVCQDGVYAVRLLRIARDNLLKDAMLIGGNAIVDEEWSYTIKKRRNIKDEYKVLVTYRGKVVISTAADPCRPVALSKAVVSVPGLMMVKAYKIE